MLFRSAPYPVQYLFDDLDIDFARRRVSRNGEKVDLPDMSWRVFAVLIERAPATVSYEDLREHAWRQPQVTQDTLSQRIKLLRQALGDDSASPRYIQTERGVGYRLASPPTRINGGRRFPRSLVPGLAGAAVILTVAVLAVILSQGTNTNDAPDNGQTISATLATDELLARGREYLSRGSHDDNERALSLFERILDAEPDNVGALTGLSFAYGHRATKYDYGTAAALRAEAFARKALRAAPREALSWHALGFSLDSQGRITEALHAYEQAIAIDPDDVNAKSSAAYLLQVQGRLHNALLLETDALVRGEPSLFSSIQIALALYLAGLDDAAYAWLDRARTLTPDNLLLDDLRMEILLSAGEFEKVLDIAAPSNNNARRAVYDIAHGEALLALGRTGEARSAFENAAAKTKDSEADSVAEFVALDIVQHGTKEPIERHPLIVSPYKENDEWPFAYVRGAYLYAAAGDSKATVELLEQARQLGYRNTKRLRRSPFFSSISDDAAFQALLAKMDADAAIQRELIENDLRLAAILGAP